MILDYSQQAVPQQEAPRTGRSTALPILNLGAGRWVVNVTPRPLYYKELAGTHGTGD